MAAKRRKRMSNEFVHNENGTTAISVTQGKVAIIDTTDFPKVAGFRWCAHRDGKTFYVLTRITRAPGEYGHIEMHRLILDCERGSIVDHKNCDGLDNRRDNLRFVSTRENAQNLRRTKISKFPGVCWKPKKRTWEAYAIVDYKRKYLGSFQTELEAAISYANYCESNGLGYLPELRSRLAS